MAFRSSPQPFLIIPKKTENDGKVLLKKTNFRNKRKDDKIAKFSVAQNVIDTFISQIQLNHIQ